MARDAVLLQGICKRHTASQNEQSVHKVNMSRKWTHCELEPTPRNYSFLKVQPASSRQESVSLSMYPLKHGLTKMSIPKAQSVGMTAFQRCGITATQAYFRGKMAQSLDTTGIEGIFLRYRGPGRRSGRGEGRSGGGGTAL